MTNYVVMPDSPAMVALREALDAAGDKPVTVHRDPVDAHDLWLRWDGGEIALWVP